MTNRLIIKEAEKAALLEIDRLNPERAEKLAWRRTERIQSKEYWERIHQALESQRINNLIIERQEFAESRKKWFSPEGRELSGEAEWWRRYGPKRSNYARAYTFERTRAARCHKQDDIVVSSRRAHQGGKI